MSKTWVALIAFAGGLGAGLLIAKFYARATVSGDISQGLQAVGVGGSTADAVGKALGAAVV